MSYIFFDEKSKKIKTDKKKSPITCGMCNKQICMDLNDTDILLRIKKPKNMCLCFYNKIKK